MKLTVVASYPYLEQFAEDICRYFKIENFDATIIITTKKRLEGDCYGMCWGDQDFVEIELARYADGGKVSREMFLKTLAHEMVHAMQYITGKMRHLGDHKHVIWKNRKYAYAEDESNKPWELEAYRLEDILYEHCQCP